MKRVLIHGALALFGLALAWRASRPAEQGSAVASTEHLFDCSPDRVTRLEWRAAHERVEILPDADASSYRVTHETRPDEGDATEKHYRGLTAVTELFSQLAPLESFRDLGEVDDAQLAELGLDDEAAQLTLACGDASQVFDVGESAYGSGKRYLRRVDGGHVYLVSADPFRALGLADGRLMQRDLHAFESTEVERVVIRARGLSRSLLQRGRRNPRAARWVDSEQPDRVNELYGNWLRDVDRLRAQRYLDEGVEPGAEPVADAGVAASATAQTVVELRYLGPDGDELGHTQVVRLGGVPERYFARSEATVGWVEVAASIGAGVARDVASVVGASAAVEAAPVGQGPAGSPTE